MSMICPSSRLSFRTIVLGTAIAALCGDGAGVAARVHGAAAAREGYGKVPLSFEANQGQSDSRVRFLSRGNGYSLFLTSNEAVVVLRQSEADQSRNDLRVARTAVGARHRKSAVVRMRLVNANPRPQAAGHDELPGKTHYFIGNDPARWRTNIPTYAKVRYEGVYPGIDLVYYGNQGRLEYDLVVAPRADPGVVALAFEGAREVRIDARGDLVLTVEGGEVRQHKPVVYQEVAGVKREVVGRYVMKGPCQVGFRVAAYDPSRPLIIDPVLVYSTYLGGSSVEVGHDIAVDGAGRAYIAGVTGSTDFPTTAGAFQTTNGGGEQFNGDAFVAKLNASGSGLVYATYLGGSADEQRVDVAIDETGNAYVTGDTTSTDFPTTAGAVQTTSAGDIDAFVTKLNATGSGLVYSTYLGGSSLDAGTGIAVDGAGSASVTGFTLSTNFPTTAGAVQTTYAGGNGDAFVTKLNAAGSGLVYSTYLGGSDVDTGFGIAVDGAGSAYVTGSARTSFPTTAGAAQTTYAGGNGDAFVTKLNATGSGLVYSTYLGGSDFDTGFGIAVDGAGSAYVTGFARSTNFPTTAGAAQTTYAGGDADAFVTKLNTAGSGLVFSTYLGGSSDEVAEGIAVDGAGSAYATGGTASTDFSTTAGAIQTTHGGGFTDAFVTKLDTTGSALVYSTYLGGVDNDSGSAIALNGLGNAYVTGFTGSTNFPTTAGAVQTTLAGEGDAFVTTLNATGSGLIHSTYLGGSFDDSAFGIAVDAAGSAYVTGRTLSTNFPTTAGATHTTLSGDSDAFVAKVGTLPTSTDQCKHGGWKTFLVFKDEGDCVSFVASKGKNPPSGP
jgi:hypothetical protein